MAGQRPETIVVKTRRGCNPSCCGCHCALPVLLVPAAVTLEELGRSPRQSV